VKIELPKEIFFRLEDKIYAVYKKSIMKPNALGWAVE